MRDRAAWTRFVEGKGSAGNKYHAVREGKYASRKEARVASELAALERCGAIRDLKEQERVVLVPGQGKIRPVIWVADFTYFDKDGQKHYVDVKGYRTPVYRLKKRLAKLALNIDIDEI